MKPIYTPGPWIACTSTERNSMPGKVYVCHYSEDGTVKPLPRTPGNAAIQAAAPELYETLKGLRAAASNTNMMTNLLDWIEAAEAVFAKIEGRK